MTAPKTPQQMLQEIERKLKLDPYYLEYDGVADLIWALSRIRQLEKALEEHTGHTYGHEEYLTPQSKRAKEALNSMPSEEI